MLQQNSVRFNTCIALLENVRPQRHWNATENTVVVRFWEESRKLGKGRPNFSRDGPQLPLFQVKKNMSCFFGAQHVATPAPRPPPRMLAKGLSRLLLHGTSEGTSASILQRRCISANVTFWLGGCQTAKHRTGSRINTQNTYLHITHGNWEMCASACLQPALLQPLCVIAGNSKLALMQQAKVKPAELRKRFLSMATRGC